MIRPDVLNDPTNQAFLDLITEDEAEVVGCIEVDSGHIEFGDCGNTQEQVSIGGDGIFDIWKGKKYIVIEIDMMNQLLLQDAVRASCK